MITGIYFLLWQQLRFFPKGKWGLDAFGVQENVSPKYAALVISVILIILSWSYLKNSKFREKNSIVINLLP